MVGNTTVVHAETTCELPRAVAARDMAGSVTLVPDNARHQRNKRVMARAAEPKIDLLFLPSYSPNLNLIERLRRLTHRQASHGPYRTTSTDFHAAVKDVPGGVEMTRAPMRRRR